ncbi:Translation initiation factor 2 [Prochlorococcus sp. SS52]|nr:Translation initiation factor 2 [Prochlorococcus marinus str. SS2]KGG24058.1 Translation initiation factor 2 [Prochlorococcus marinus str. SS35]KGG31683.1 Translation initiation factor 2 [Prochlorococcus marinus str. SS51]KGG34750.1 Translation initiation factor 2 [Prochlorococcus sp. SS52]
MLDAANKLSISAKSHSSSISDEDATKIKKLLLAQKSSNSSSPPAKQKPNKEILTLKKAITSPPTKSEANAKTNASLDKTSSLKNKPASPKKEIPTSPKPPSAAKQRVDAIKKPTPSISKNNSLKVQPTIKKPSLVSPKQPNIPSPPIAPNKGIKPTIKRQDSNNENLETNKTKAKPNIVSKPQARQIKQSSDLINRSPKTSPKQPIQEIQTNKPKAPQRPIAPPPRPKVQSQFNQKPGNNNLRGGPNQRKGIPQGAPSGQPGSTKHPRNLPTGSYKGNRVELVGAPIRRNTKPDNGGRGARDGNFRQGGPNQGPPISRQGGARRQEGGGGRGQQMRPRTGMPPGMRKPVAPGELMQLQKPTSSATPPIKRGDLNKGPKKDGISTAKPPANRPTPSAAPKRPPARTGAPGSSRKRKPDWDDAAKLEALRNKSPQKQRQKVHIIGENDDALTAETSGFAGGGQAVVLSASLARPGKPKASKKSGSKPTGALRKRKKESTRQRQRRRAMELRAAREAKQIRPEMIVVPEDNITVQELADKLSVESSEIIKSLFFKGITATVTQSLDLSTIETVAEEFGVPVLQDDIEEAAKKTVEMIEETDIKHLTRRPPVVTVMGHVDHGKTSLLDAIRKARVAAGEAGGITQHIGAYQVEVEHEKKLRTLTFLDTPGHEAFTAMRARGTKVTDVAVLVVAADDGVRPQTLEAISHARAAKVPIVVAINKIDKEGASPDRVKQELSEQELVAEEWGGDVVMMPVSAIKGENIDKLLEMILLVTEVEDLQANPARLAKGTVIEAHLDKAKGPVATLLVQNGTLKAGDVVAAGPVLGKVRAMVDENGKRLKEAGPSCPVEALGFNEVPTAGDEFEVYPDEKSARSVVGERASDARATRLAQQMASRRVSLSAMSGQVNDGDLKELNLILKADVQGSVEAILGSLEQLPKDEVQVRVLLSAPGEITETDVDLAAASGAVIIGFNTSMASGAKKAADANSVDVRDYEVIYKLLEDIQLAMEGLLEPDLVEEKIGEAEVRAIFTIGKSAVAGCYITNGKLQRNCKVRVKRADQIVFNGDLDSLRRNKDVVKDVSSGFECGIGCDRFANWKEGDTIEGYKLVTQRRKLNT